MVAVAVAVADVDVEADADADADADAVAAAGAGAVIGHIASDWSDTRGFVVVKLAAVKSAAAAGYSRLPGGRRRCR